MEEPRDPDAVGELIVDLDEVVITAAELLTSKVEKQHLKHCNRKEKKYKLSCLCCQDHEHLCECEEKMLKLEDGKKSPVFMTPPINRRISRREGVAETDEADRRIAKEAVKALAMTNNLAELEILMI